MLFYRHFFKKIPWNFSRTTLFRSIRRHLMQKNYALDRLIHNDTHKVFLQDRFKALH